jgi:hypothetical protein
MKESTYIIIIITEGNDTVQLVVGLPLGIQETFFKLSILW